MPAEISTSHLSLIRGARTCDTCWYRPCVKRAYQACHSPPVVYRPSFAAGIVEKYPDVTPVFLARIRPIHLVSFVHILTRKSVHKVLLGSTGQASRGHATRSSLTVRAGKSISSRYRPSSCVPRRFSWTGKNVA